MKRVLTGVLGLDKLLMGGVWKYSVVTVVGTAGTGKTTFAIQFLRMGLKLGERGIFISVEQTKDDILNFSERMGWIDFVEAVEKGDVQVIPVELSLKGTVESLEKLVKYEDEHMRIVIDSITPFLLDKMDRELRNHIAAIFRNLKSLGTSVVVTEAPGKIKSEDVLRDPITNFPIFLADTVISLEYVGLRPHTHLLEIVKHRGSAHAIGSYGYRILPKFGIVVDSRNFNPFSEEMRDKLDREIRKIVDELRGNIILDEHSAEFIKLAVEQEKELERMLESEI